MIRVAEPAAALPIAGGEMGTKSERKRHFRASATEKMTPRAAVDPKSGMIIAMVAIQASATALV